MIRLDGKKMADRKAMHAYLKEALHLPEYYGANLDALNDCLGEMNCREEIEITNAGIMMEACGAYGTRLIQVLEDNGIRVMLKNEEEN